MRVRDGFSATMESRPHGGLRSLEGRSWGALLKGRLGRRRLYQPAVPLPSLPTGLVSTHSSTCRSEKVIMGFDSLILNT